MNKLILSLMISTLVVASFAGCTKKNGSGGDNNTNASSLDENAIYDAAVADTGYRVTGSLKGTGTALTAGANGSAVSVKVIDKAPDDSGGALDKADFLVDAKEADGSRLQAELRSMTTAKDYGVSGDFFGGVAHNIEINGDTGLGYSDLPKTKAYLFLTGLARAKYNDGSLEAPQLVQVAVTQGIHKDADGSLLDAADPKDLELQVLFPGSLLGANHTFPNVTDGFLYYYFENVKLTQMLDSEKTDVGSKLKPADKPNVPPVANAAILVNGTQNNSADFDPDKKFLNVTLDASNSTDSDGTIQAYSWDVKELNANGTLVPLNRTSGAIANFSFTTPGQKQVELRIIDDQGGIANATVTFFVNYKKTFEVNFGANTGTSVGGGTSCTQGSNCNPHFTTIGYGAKQMVVNPPKQVGGTCSGPTTVVKDPTGAQLASSGSVIKLDQSKLAKVGKYEIDPYFQAQVQCHYTLLVQVSYDAAKP